MSSITHPHMVRFNTVRRNCADCLAHLINVFLNMHKDVNYGCDYIVCFISHRERRAGPGLSPVHIREGKATGTISPLSTTVRTETQSLRRSGAVPDVHALELPWYQRL